MPGLLSVNSIVPESCPAEGKARRLVETGLVGAVALHLGGIASLEPSAAHVRVAAAALLVGRAAASATDPSASHTRHARNVTRGGRTLVALIGQIRGGELAERSLIQHVLKPNQADLVLMVPKTASLLNSSLAARARYVWTLREPENWKQPIAAIAQALGAHRWLDLANVSGAVAFLGPALLWRGVRSPSTAAPNLVYRHLLKRHLVQHRLIERYTRFIITRADHVYGCHHDVSRFDLHHHVYVPLGEDYGGVCDRHIVCGQADVLACLSIIDGPLLHPERYVKQADSMATCGPEPFMKLRLQELGLWPRLRRFARVMYLSSDKGNGSSVLNKTSKEPSYPKPAAPGQHVKYLDEFVATRWTCGFCKGLGAGQPFCCPLRRPTAMVLEGALASGKLAYVEPRTGDCQLSRAVILALTLASGVILAGILAVLGRRSRFSVLDER